MKITSRMKAAMVAALMALTGIGGVGYYATQATGQSPVKVNGAEASAPEVSDGLSQTIEFAVKSGITRNGIHIFNSTLDYTNKANKPLVVPVDLMPDVADAGKLTGKVITAEAHAGTYRYTKGKLEGQVVHQWKAVRILAVK